MQAGGGLTYHATKLGPTAKFTGEFEVLLLSFDIYINNFINSLIFSNIILSIQIWENVLHVCFNASFFFLVYIEKYILFLVSTFCIFKCLNSFIYFDNVNRFNLIRRYYSESIMMLPFFISCRVSFFFSFFSSSLIYLAGSFIYRIRDRCRHREILLY